jgi:predicted DNA-binding mobile mystery protein A
MSQAALAQRLNITPGAVAQLEAAEREGGITINRLIDAARALDCELVYALVPRKTLDDTVRAQARAIVARDFGYVESTMTLEDQGIGEEQRDKIELFAADLIRDGRIWETA